jgi:hypothetical protein
MPSRKDSGPGAARTPRAAATGGAARGDADAVSVSANYNAPIKQLELRASRPYNIMALAVGWEFAAMAEFSRSHLSYLPAEGGATRYRGPEAFCWPARRAAPDLGYAAAPRSGVYGKAANESGGRRAPVHRSLRAALVAREQNVADRPLDRSAVIR